ncbi:MAG: hypothetical protein WBG41_15915 [Acidimicrobiales bacterium]
MIGQRVTDSSSRWILTVGMHRSGTSAAAGTLGELGAALPRAEDRVEWRASNPEHHESLSATIHNERLLQALGGAWDAPPILRQHWAQTASVVAGGASSALLRAAFPVSTPAAWKDPRLCLLLPYWRMVLTGPMNALFVWRPPGAVARSLQWRDQIPVSDALALWERYNRMAVQNLAGMTVLVVDYDSMVDDPRGFASSCQTWFGLGERCREARAPIRPQLRHHSAVASPIDLSAQQQRLWSCLEEITSGHAVFPTVDLGEETPDVEPAFERRRPAANRRREREAANRTYFAMRSELLETRKALRRIQASTTWRLTQPLRRVVGHLERTRRSLGIGPS